MIALLVLLLAASLALPAGAQGATAPEEPDIVLPEVILRIEDFSVEALSGAAPGEEEALPPARELPLPAGEVPLLAEPPAPPAAEVPAGLPTGLPAEARERPLSALAELGAGSMNHLFSQVALHGLGEEPRFRLRFLHETLDGMAGEEPGSGFSLRQDELEGALKFHLGRVAVDLDAGLREEERGLQGRSTAPDPFVSRLLRTFSPGAELAWPFAEHWTLSGSLDGSFTAQLFTGAAPEGLLEAQVSPQIALEVRMPRFWLGVEGRYARRLLDGEPTDRATASGRFGVDFSKAVRLEGSGGWHWGTLSGHLFPFALSLMITPNPSFSLLAAGGYRVEELAAGDLLLAYPWAELPDPILEDHGWYTDLTATFSLRRAFSLQAGGHLAWHRAVPEPQTALGLGPRGLYPLTQVEAARAAVEASLRWSPARETYLSAGWRMQVAKHPAFTPGTELRLDGGAGGERWGVHGSLVVNLGYDPAQAYTLTPELSLGGFFQASKAVRLVAEAEDLLAPLAGGPRLDWDPFVEPGIRATLKAQINL